MPLFTPFKYFNFQNEVRHLQPSFVSPRPLVRIGGGGIPALLAASGEDEIDAVHYLGKLHDRCYKSINLGEDVIKEMIMSSIFGIPISAKAAMTAYRLMIQRVTRVAQNFDKFINLPFNLQGALLKHNSDMVVSLRGAVFFEMKKQGMDQILISLGIDDIQSAQNIISATLKNHSVLNHIDYKTFNTIQEKVDSTVEEQRYDQLLSRVGSTVAFNANLVKILTYILLFSGDIRDPRVDRAAKRATEMVQEGLILMLQRYLSATYPPEMATSLFGSMMNCIADLRELTWIKKQRRLALGQGSNTPSPPTNMDAQ